MVGTKTKHSDSDKTKMKAMKPQKKKPVVPKIKIKALQMASTSDQKGVTKGDKKESKITDVFHFDYQPPSGSGVNPNAQYSSLYQDSKIPSNFGTEKQDPRGECFDASSSPASSIAASHSQTMSPRIDPEALDVESPSYRAWKKNILLLWKTAAQNKYAHIFMHPVTDDLAPGYSSTVRRPIDLTTIKRKIDSNEIRTTAQFHRDMLLMFHNALMYNNASHSVYAYTVAMLTDVMEIIKAFYSSHNHAPDKHLQKSMNRSRAACVASQ
jgi:bromodomain-containing protein 8